MKEQAKQIYYQCATCKQKRHLIINLDYHSRKARGGLTRYNDYHECNSKNEPTIIAIDGNFQVRTQSQGNAFEKKKEAKKKSLIPSPTVKSDTNPMKYTETIGKLFKYLKLNINIMASTYFMGEQDNNSELYAIKSDSGLFETYFQINKEYEEYRDIIKYNVQALCNLLEVGRELDIDTVSSLFNYITEKYRIKLDKTDQDIIKYVTFASVIWLSWGCENSGKYATKYLGDIIPDTELVDKIMGKMAQPKYSVEQIATQLNIDITKTMAICMLLEKFGLLKYEYKEV